MVIEFNITYHMIEIKVINSFVLTPYLLKGVI